MTSAALEVALSTALKPASGLILLQRLTLRKHLYYCIILFSLASIKKLKKLDFLSDFFNYAEQQSSFIITDIIVLLKSSQNVYDDFFLEQWL